MAQTPSQNTSGITEAADRWARLAKTDPAHTKQFNRSGFKGTALKPIWLIKRMTEEFGTAGIGWGITEPKFDTIFIQDKEPLVYCHVGVWVESPANLVYGVGGDTMLRVFKNGESVVDDEAFKKAYTDAVNNAFKYFGIGGDVHMGQFEDSKYVQAVGRHFEEEAETPEVKAVRALTAGSIPKAASVDDLNKVVADNKAAIDAVSTQRPALVQSLRTAYAMRKKQLES